MLLVGNEVGFEPRQSGSSRHALSLSAAQPL